MGVAATPVPKGLWPHNPTKNWPMLGSFWVTCYLKIVFPNFQILDPPLISLAKVPTVKNGLILRFEIVTLNDFGSPGVLKQHPIAKNCQHINICSTLACY